MLLFTSFFLPILLLLTAGVGLAVLFNGLRGAFTGMLIVPNLRDPSNRTFSELTGKPARKAGTIGAALGFLVLCIGVLGLNLTLDFLSSPAYVRYLVPPPGEAEILYSLGEDDEREIAYAMKGDIQEVSAHFKKELQGEEWKILRDTPVSIVAAKGAHQVTLSFIRIRGAKTKEFRSKVIVLYRRDPS